MPFFEVTRGRYSISTDPQRLDTEAIHSYLTRSYWAEGIPRDIVAKSLAFWLPRVSPSDARCADFTPQPTNPG